MTEKSEEVILIVCVRDAGGFRYILKAEATRCATGLDVQCEAKS